MAFIGAQRRPFTEEAGGAGAGFSREGLMSQVTRSKAFNRGESESRNRLKLEWTICRCESGMRFAEVRVGLHWQRKMLAL